MPVMTFNKGYVERLIGSKLESIAFEDTLWKMGFSVEGSTADEISIEITPNRPDMLDAVGFARAFRLFTGKSKQYEYSLKDRKPELTVKVGNAVKSVRPYIALLTARNLSFTEESLTNLLGATDKFTDTYGRKRKKIAIGIHNLDSVSGSIVYDAYKEGRYVPLGSSKESNYAEVLSSHEKGIRYSEALGKRHNMYPALKDGKGTLALIPILNSERTKVTKATKNLLIDITGQSEYLVSKTADLLASVFMDMGADVGRVEVAYTGSRLVTPVMQSRYIAIGTKRIESELGATVGANAAMAMGNRMGYSTELSGTKVVFGVPSYRVDIINEQDVLEDLLIAYGYDNIAPLPVPSVAQGSAEDIVSYRTRLEDLMLGLGFNQMYNSYLSNDPVNFTMMRHKPSEYAVRIKNPKTEAATLMRTWLLPSLMRNVGMSLNERMPLNVFELDMAFNVEDGKPMESYHLAAVSCSPKANFNDIKAMVDAVCSSIGIAYHTERSENPSFIDGRCARLISDGIDIGAFGEIHPEALSNFKIEEPAIGFEITLPIPAMKRREIEQ